MTEKELEKLFKSKLESGSYPYNPSAWQAMENILDQKVPRGGAFFWRSAAAVFLFGFFAASVLWLQPDPAGNGMPRESDPIFLPEISLSPDAYPTEKPGLASGRDEFKVKESIAPVDIRVTDADLHPMAEAYPPAGSETGQTNSYGEDAANTSANRTQLHEKFPDQSALVINESAESYLLLTKKQTPLISYSSMTAVPPIRAAIGHQENSSPYVRPHSLHLAGGTLLNEAYHNSEMGVGFNLGARYHYLLRPDWQFTAGLNYSRINKLGVQQQFDSLFYHFKRERVETKITGSRLHYVELPVGLQWEFAPRHLLEISAYAAVLLNVSEEVERKHYTGTDEVYVERQTHSGMPEPYRRFDLGLGASYFFEVSRFLQLGAELRKGFTDITSGKEGVYALEHQNMNARISLRYRIL